MPDHLGGNALHQLLVSVVGIRQVERRFTQLDGEYEQHADEHADARADDGRGHAADTALTSKRARGQENSLRPKAAPWARKP